MVVFYGVHTACVARWRSKQLLQLRAVRLMSTGDIQLCPASAVAWVPTGAAAAADDLPAGMGRWCVLCDANACQNVFASTLGM